MDKNYYFAIDVLNALKEEVERKTNRKFMIDIYLSNKIGSTQNFSLLNGFFKKDWHESETFSFLCCKFSSKDYDGALMTFRMGLTACSLAFNRNPQIQNLFPLIYSADIKLTSSFEETFSRFGALIEEIVINN